MPEYLRPGVYVEETSYRAKAIQGVEYSTAGFVGAARMGPEGRPWFVTSLGDFRRTFGDPISPPQGLGDYLGHAVKAFFDNGGSRAYVVRVLPGDATSSSVVMEQGVVLSLPPGVTVRGPTTTIPLNSLRQVEVGSVLHVFTRAAAADPFTETHTLTVQSYDAQRNRVVVDPALADGEALAADHTYFLIDGVAPHGVGGTGNGPTVVARHRGVDGDRLSIRIRPTDRAPVPLRTATVLRAQPAIDSIAIVPVGTTDLELSVAALRSLRAGDQIAVGSAAVTVSAIDDGEIDYAVVAGGAAADYTGGGTISLIARGGNALVAPLPLGAIPAGAFDLTAPPVPPLTQALPHDIIATLQVGDRIALADGVNADALDITAVRLSQDLAAGPHVHLAGPVAAPTAPVAVRLLATSDANPDVARLVVASVAGFAAPARPGTSEPIAVTNGTAFEAATILLVDAVTNSLWVSKANPAAAARFSTDVDVSNWTSVERLQVAADGAATVAVANTVGLYSGAKAELDTGIGKFEVEVLSIDSAARTVTFLAGLPLGANVYVDAPAVPAARNVYLRVAEIDIEVQQDGVTLEPFKGLTWNNRAGTDALDRYFVDRINDDELGSKLIRIDAAWAPGGTLFVNQPTTADGRALALGAVPTGTPGSNGSAITANDLIGEDNGAGNRTGIKALVERDDISIVAVPGVVEQSVQNELITHCELLKYRMAVLDGPLGNRLVTDIQAHRFNYDSKYAAYYAPWLETLDTVSGRTILVPPSGHAMGIYARTDSTVGVWKAPANEVVRNITGIEFPFGNAEQDVLNPVGVNLIRDLTPRGRRLWGARTISSDTEWTYVNVRRLFIFLEHSIDKGTQWVVFEPNNERLWARVVETVTSFLTGVWKSGALMGTTPEQAFFVTCDRSTMSQDDLDNGRLICEIGVSPAYPAEFVIFRIGQWTADAS